MFATVAAVVLTDSAKENRYTDRGREWDEGLGLYHFRARTYDVESGRFCGRDPARYIGELHLSLAYFSKNLSSLGPYGLEDCRIVQSSVVFVCQALGQSAALSSDGVSQNPVNLEGSFNIYCECAIQQTDPYRCTDIWLLGRMIGGACGSAGQEISKRFKTTWLEDDVTYTGTAKLMPFYSQLIGYALTVLPLPGNGGLGFALYEFDESCRQNAHAACKSSCLGCFAGLGHNNV